MWIDSSSATGPCRPQLTATLCTISGQCMNSGQTKRPYLARAPERSFSKPHIENGQNGKLNRSAVITGRTI